MTIRIESRDFLVVATDLPDDPELRQKFGANGKAKVLEQFDWHKMADILEEEYAALLKNNRR